MPVSRGAKACATKRNNIIKKKYPLLLPAIQDWLTTPEEQQKRLDIEHAEADAYFARLDELTKKLERRAEDLRAQVAQWVDPAQLAELDAYRNRTYPKTPDYSCDFWRSKLKQLGKDSFV
jgi:hypothetical protein